uniref:Integrase catalytic domain-containing protein n=1 Tax=Meloidogyne hapla TaxID=6305 RepID=A0A1I8BGC7_MELHA
MSTGLEKGKEMAEHIIEKCSAIISDETKSAEVELEELNQIPSAPTLEQLEEKLTFWIISLQFSAKFPTHFQKTYDVLIKDVNNMEAVNNMEFLTFIPCPPHVLLNVLLLFKMLMCVSLSMFRLLPSQYDHQFYKIYMLQKTYGLIIRSPKELASDNGTQFSSSELAKFCKEYGIKQTFTPPFHPQSNGQVERFVDTFKRAMKKGKGDKLWCEKMLLSYRSTPHSALQGYSPDQLFLGRQLRTQLSLVHHEGQKKNSKGKIDRKEYTKKMERQ